MKCFAFHIQFFIPFVISLCMPLYDFADDEFLKIWEKGSIPGRPSLGDGGDSPPSPSQDPEKPAKNPENPEKGQKTCFFDFLGDFAHFSVKGSIPSCRGHQLMR